MIRSLRRTTGIYSAVAATEAKTTLAYNLWVWSDFVMTIVSMVIFVYFWKAVYADTATLGGLSLDQTITYILMARILSPVLEPGVIFFFGDLIHEGQIAVELTRPLDLQGRTLVDSYARLGMIMLQRLPLFPIAWLFLGLRFPHDPAQWLAFAVTLVLGKTVLFMFDWIFACLLFYTTETWGMSVVRNGLSAFFSGALIPLAMMPLGLRTLAGLMPFAQALSVPVGFLSGITPASELPRLLLIQLVWLVVLFLASRRIFDVAVRKVTVQGG